MSAEDSMSACELVPHNCADCGFWTAMEISRTREGRTRECTIAGTRRKQSAAIERFDCLRTRLGGFECRHPCNFRTWRA